VRRLLGKLDIADSDDAHRRVLAVLTYLRADRDRACHTGKVNPICPRSESPGTYLPAISGELGLGGPNGRRPRL
jgi:hypothetical protein